MSANVDSQPADTVFKPCLLVPDIEFIPNEPCERWVAEHARCVWRAAHPEPTRPVREWEKYYTEGDIMLSVPDEPSEDLFVQAAQRV